MMPGLKNGRYRAMLLAAPVSIAAASAVIAASAMVKLMVNGETASTSVLEVNGRAYVPLADMAAAMHGKLVKTAGGYQILLPGAATAAGGANQVQGLQGKVGDVLFDGKWRFQVVSVDRAATYESRFAPEKTTFQPDGDANELVVVTCQLKNGMKQEAKALLSRTHPHHIALTDDHGQSYPPTGFDKRTDSTDEGPNLLPGAATDFAVIFDVPKGTAAKDLVFSLQRAYDDYPDGGSDVRISLVK